MTIKHTDTILTCPNNNFHDVYAYASIEPGKDPDYYCKQCEKNVIPVEIKIDEAMDDKQIQKKRMYEAMKPNLQSGGPIPKILGTAGELPTQEHKLIEESRKRYQNSKKFRHIKAFGKITMWLSIVVMGLFLLMPLFKEYLVFFTALNFLLIIGIEIKKHYDK